MYAMFVAFALRSQVRYASLVPGSKLLPFAFLRFRAESMARSPVVAVVVIRAWPFLFDQKPIVSPPPAPVQTLPKYTPVTLEGWSFGITTVYDFAFSDEVAPLVDRKSTRLNSSHRTISYAVFCLKKKKNINYIN